MRPSKLLEFSMFKIGTFIGAIALAVILLPKQTLAQKTSSIEGLIFNSTNKNPVVGASIQIQGTTTGTVSGDDGRFELKNLAPGLYNLEVTHASFIGHVEYNIRTLSIKPVYIEIGLIEAVLDLDGVVVNDEKEKAAVLETNIAEKEISHDEMQRLPGANLDISRAIQAYPGMLPQASFGYNLSTRGGSPAENGFYLDGIKIPALNHFSIQGSSGGPNALLNMDFIQKVKLNTGVFPVELGDAVSSMVNIQQRNGRTDRLGARITMGATDVGATLEGPLGKKGNFIASSRYSFSQYLLRAFNVPVLPTYADAQFRARWMLDPKNELIITGVGGTDQYRLNTDAPESDALLYNIGYIPEGDQKLYAIGANYRHYLDHSYYNVVVSTNGFDNVADKFDGNTGLEEDRTLRYYSHENEIHFRLEHHIFRDKIEFDYGVNAANVSTSTDVFALDITPSVSDTVNFKGQLNMLAYGAFAKATRKFANDRLEIDAGLRIDGTNYNSTMSNPFNQLSPRATVRYRVNKKLGLNASSGLYFQRPQSIILAYSENNNTADLSYISCAQTSAGMEYKTGSYRLSLEGYYKHYLNYPFLLRDSISAANAMANYVVVGNQPAESTSQGRGYGVELFVQQKLKRNYWWMLAYTYSVSEFEDKNGVYQPSSFDSRHYASIIAGKTLKRNWQIGVKWRYSSGTPYTPYDVSASARMDKWDIANRGLFDFNQVNAERLPAFHSMDLRFDKRYHFEKSNLSFFFDIQNLYESNIQLMPYLALDRDDNLNSQIDPSDPSRYLLEQIDSDTGRRLYALGVIWEF